MSLIKLALFSTCLLITQAWALPGDKFAKLFITADSAVYNYKTGHHVFTGHVVVDQGTSHITADKLITTTANHQLREAEAIGIKNLAHYWTIKRENELPLNAEAKIIKYYPLASLVVLKDNVVVTQGKNRFQGQIIHYNNKYDIITVPPTENSRATIIYNPDSKT